MLRRYEELLSFPEWPSDSRSGHAPMIGPLWEFLRGA